MNIKPFYGMSRRCYLQELCNKYGDFKVAKGWKDENTGEIIWTKHRSVLSCWHSEEGLLFLDTVNNRTALPIELRIDTDPKDGETPAQALAKFNQICDWLEDNKMGNYQGYSSGSRGYHIHILSPQIMLWTEHRKRELKEWMLQQVGGDMLKASNNTMLTLEFSPNNKTGKLKLPVRGNFRWE